MAETNVYIEDNEASVYFYKKIGVSILEEKLNIEINKIEYSMSYGNKE